jgi:hypothetical protein
VPTHADNVHYVSLYQNAYLVMGDYSSGAISTWADGLSPVNAADSIVGPTPPRTLVLGVRAVLRRGPPPPYTLHQQQWPLLNACRDDTSETSSATQFKATIDALTTRCGACTAGVHLHLSIIALYQEIPHSMVTCADSLAINSGHSVHCEV